ncbi:MAG: hypothetical protein NTW94_06210 [Legionellales bacterium]|nr:hypothetical protein [Legionellales bacterium]
MRKLVLWGHPVEEYLEMFDLPSTALSTRWLEYGCGPSAVNAMQHARGQRVVSCDPLFQLDKLKLQLVVDEAFDHMVQQVRLVQHVFDFSRYGSLDALIQSRREGLSVFFKDYEQGVAEKRYLPVSEPLPFPDFSFDVALSSHHLFEDLDDQDVDFHITTICELARVAKEVRIFPLIDRFGKPSSFLGPVLLGLQNLHYGVEVREVTYSFQAKGNAMLRVWAELCQF